ncbi:28S ribosomal protein S15, mitochondrial [Nomia melanderi]|uniref:28S ribosomal protein S15, mitochondrial n=1 Tax=Nomia melanderi TaxID=2448451 RepID=UPI0013040C5D|nr:28S ribosomal protein S15, mitochondrial [Nomia melanderi]
MNLASNICRLSCTRTNNLYKFGGYVSRNVTTIEFYKINWKRPARVGPTSPTNSGDLGLDISVKPTDIPLYYDRSKELEDANDFVKKMFSLEFHPRREVRNLKREKIMALVKRHELDRGSTESAIAAMTSEILYIQEYMKEHPYNKQTKRFLKELVERRKKYLRHLRKWDYRRFEWVLERLNLVYKPDPAQLGTVSRKDSIRLLTQEYCDKLVQDKLNAYKAELKAKQKEFYREKAEKLAFILKEERECGVEPSVTEENIQIAKRKAEELS